VTGPTQSVPIPDDRPLTAAERAELVRQIEAIAAPLRERYLGGEQRR